jgi:outer membrane protein
MTQFCRAILVLTLWSIGQSTWSDNLISTYHDAVQGDPRLKIADIKVGLGEATEQQASGNLLPQISGRASLSENRQDLERELAQNIIGGRNSFPGERYSLALTQPLFDLPKYHRWRRQQELTGQSKAERIDVNQQLILDVVEAYFTILRYEDDLALVSHEITATESLVTQVGKLYEKKLAKITELLEARATLDKLFADQVEARSQVAIARERLHELTGKQPGVLDSLRDDLKFFEMEGTLEEWVARVKSQNSALVGLNRAADAQEQGLKEQRAGRLPVVDLQLSHQKSDLGFENAQRPTTTTDFAGINFNMPIFTSGVISGKISEAAHRLEMTRLEYETEYRMLIKEARDALLRTNTSVRRITAFEKAFDSADKSTEAMRKGYQLGAVTIADVLDAQSGRFIARRDLNRSRYDYVINRTRLLRVSGVVNEQELEVMNQWLVHE